MVKAIQINYSASLDTRQTKTSKTNHSAGRQCKFTCYMCNQWLFVQHNFVFLPWPDVPLYLVQVRYVCSDLERLLHLSSKWCKNSSFLSFKYLIRIPLCGISTSVKNILRYKWCYMYDVIYCFEMTNLHSSKNLNIVFNELRIILFVCVFVCTFVYLFVCLEFFTHAINFTHLKMSTLPVKGCKFWPMIGIHCHWAVRNL